MTTPRKRDDILNELSDLLVEARLDDKPIPHQKLDEFLSELLDKDSQQHAQELELRRAEHEEAARIRAHDEKMVGRDSHRANIWMTFGILAALVIICFTILWLNRPKAVPPGTVNSTQLQSECIQAGGTWMPGKLLVSVPNSSGICIMPSAPTA